MRLGVGSGYAYSWRSDSVQKKTVGAL